METKVTLESIDKKFDMKFDALDKKLGALDSKIDAGFTAVYQKIDILDNKVEIHRKVIVDRFDAMDTRFDRLENRIDDLAETKVSYDEHNKLAHRVSKMEAR